MLRLALLFVLSALPLRAETALAAVAANFAAAAQVLATDYGAQSGHEVTITTGSTGKLYAQIGLGAPYDLLLAADAETPQLLAQSGHGTPFTYAFGRLALWLPKAAPGADAASLLQDPNTRHIAIANPDLAPYGRAAIAALQNMGLYAATSGKIIFGQNAGQAYALVESGAAEAGFVARAALAPDAAGFVYQVPEDLYPAIRQDAVLLRHGMQNAAAQGFLDYLSTAPARATIAGFGYGVAP